MDILADIQREWDLAETAVKRSEQVANDAIIPAINELRYAGRRVIDALNAAGVPDNEAKVAAYLEDARFNCHRARHDAMDAALDIIARDFDNLTQRLGYDAVTRAYPGFSELYADFAVARSKIAARNRAQRIGFWVMLSIAVCSLVFAAFNYSRSSGSESPKPNPVNQSFLQQ